MDSGRGIDYDRSPSGPSSLEMLPSPLPKRFDRYEVTSLLGDGAMGRVYCAFDPLARRKVAIKTLKSEYLTRGSGEEYVRRFRREAQAAGGLLHPNIVTIFDVGEDYFVMEFLEGSSLQTLIGAKGRFALPEAMAILGPVADALDFAHARGTVHRDIKPANIMVLPDGRPKLLDFGVAHLTSTVMTATGQLLGSPAYMAPEQIRDSEASPRTDLFSLAVVAYEMLTGRRPFEGTNVSTIIYRVVNEPAPPPRQWNADLPARYDEIFVKALAKDPAQRYASARAFVGALELRDIDEAFERILEAPPAPAPEAVATLSGTAETLAARPATARAAPVAARLATGLAAAAVVLLGAVGVFLLRGRAPSVVEPDGSAPPGAAEEAPAAPAVAPKETRPPSDAQPKGVAAPRKATAAPPAPPRLRQGDFVEPGPGVVPPRRVAGETASYPEAARRARLEGSVLVEVVVDERGRPGKARILESGGEILDQAVLKVVGTWRFEPAIKDGVKVKTRWKTRHTFRMR